MRACSVSTECGHRRVESLSATLFSEHNHCHCLAEGRPLLSVMPQAQPSTMAEYSCHLVTKWTSSGSIHPNDERGHSKVIEPPLCRHWSANRRNPRRNLRALSRRIELFHVDVLPATPNRTRKRSVQANSRLCLDERRDLRLSFRVGKVNSFCHAGDGNLGKLFSDFSQ